MKKSIVFLVIFLMLLPCISACSEKERPSCREILEELKKNEVSLPSGKTYDIRAVEGDDTYLTEKLLISLYGNGSMPPMSDGWIDIAVFMPTSMHPCEFSVVLCNNEDTAADTARLLISRLDTVRTAKSESEFAYMLDSAKVTIIRNYVLLIISSDTDNALKTASKLIK